MYMKLPRYSSSAAYTANSDPHSNDQQNQKQTYNYYSQQGATYYCPPVDQAPASCPPVPPPTDVQPNDKQPVEDSRELGDQSGQQNHTVPSNSIGSDSSQTPGKVLPETTGERSCDVDTHSQGLPAQDQGPAKYGSQVENYQGYNQQSSGNQEQQSYNPETPTNDYSEWKQQAGSQQQQQQWYQQGWTWNSYQGTWQHSSWPQQQQQQQQSGLQGNDQQQQQWSGWGQWAGQGGGQWPVQQQQQQPGTEGWTGQFYQAQSGYNQQNYNYPGMQ